MPESVDTRALERQARTLHPGGWAVESERPIATILGSCVAVCLHEPRLGLCGMNHFLLPRRHAQSAYGEEDPDVVLAGDYAMEVLVNAMLARGASKSSLIAKAFGGGTVMHSLQTMIGEDNARFAREWLQREGIALVAEDLGGACSRKVVAVPNGDVFCRRMAVVSADVQEAVNREWSWQQKGQKEGGAVVASSTRRIELF